LFQLFHFYTETEIFDVSIEPKQTEDQAQQFEHILVFFRKFSVFPVFPEIGCFGCFASILKQRVSMFRLNRNKQKTNRNSLIESIFWYFYENLGLFRFFSKQFCCFLRLFRYRFETLKQTGFTKQTDTKPKQILFRFVSVRTEIFLVCFEDTLAQCKKHFSRRTLFHFICPSSPASPVS
jgi:hypothetical protein